MLIDQGERDSILTDQNSIVISASAGSGKTTIMVEKIKGELDNIVNHMTVAAITFTVKATDEIKRKANLLSIDKEFTVMTNDAFIEYEIIRPFITDAYGAEYSCEYIVEYENKHKISSFEDGKLQLCEKNILGSFRDIKKNFNFKVAIDVLNKSYAARQYIQSKYKTIFVDEYQDSDIDMHNFFMKLKNELGIKLFIVGDSKQAIYLWRGANENIFSVLSKADFSYYELVTNFRCHPEIVNYANLIYNPDYFDSSYDMDVQKVIHYESSDFISGFKSLIKGRELDINKEITIISNFNNDAKNYSELLNESGFQFVFIPRTPLDEGTPNSHLLKQLAFYTKDPFYSIYDFIENTNIDERSQTVLEVQNIIRNLKNNKYWTIQRISEIMVELFEFINVEISKNELDRFTDSITDEQFEKAFIRTNDKHKVMTVFASKGLEFEQVITFSNYYPIYYNEKTQNHYVSITRAKEKFVIFLNNDQRYDEYLREAANKAGLINIENLIKIIR